MRWVIRSILALLLLVFLAVALLFLIPGERIARVAANKFQEITGRSLQIEGAVRPSFWPSLGVKTGRVVVANADWSEAGPMFEAEGLSINIDMAALIAGDVRITGIEADRPKITLERAVDGKENWVFGGDHGGSAEPGMAGEGKPFTLDLAEVKSGAFSFIDHQTGNRIDLSALSGKVRIPNFTGAAELDLSAVMQGQAFTLRGSIAEFASFLEGKVTGVTARLDAGDADLGFEGRAGWAGPSAEGSLTADLGNLGAVTKLAGMARPDLPEGLGRDHVAVSGRVTLTDQGSVHLRSGQVVLDSTKLAIDADLSQGEARPKLSAKVAAGALNLAPMVAADTGATGGGAQGGGAQGGRGVEASGWPKQQIDVAGLSLMDAAITLSADSVDLGVSKFGQTDVVVTLDRGRAVFDLRQVQAYQGKISGQFVINGRSGLSVGGNLTLADLALQPMLIDLGGFDRLVGIGNVKLDFLGVGNSIDQIMHSLSGSGSINLGKGEILGLDIAGMLRNLDPSYVGQGQKTIFDGLSATFTMDKGVLSNNDLSLRAPYVNATGAGRVGLGARDLDYRLRPTALPSTDGTGGLMVPLIITGPWADPKFRLDLEALNREQLEAEAKALEARTKAEFERKAERELGLVRGEGESLEDAAKRRAEEALEAEGRRVLERLFGR